MLSTLIPSSKINNLTSIGIIVRTFLFRVPASMLFTLKLSQRDFNTISFMITSGFLRKCRLSSANNVRYMTLFSITSSSSGRKLRDRSLWYSYWTSFWKKQSFQNRKRMNWSRNWTKEKILRESAHSCWLILIKDWYGSSFTYST